MLTFKKTPIDHSEITHAALSAKKSRSLIWIERLKLLKEILINLVMFSVVTSLGFVFYYEWQREPVVIEPLIVPESFAKQGYSGTVLSNRLMDQVLANQEDSYMRLPENQKYLFPVEVTDDDSTDNLNIEIPETGMSLGLVIQYIRHLRGVETRISGDLVGHEDQFELTIRVKGKPKTVTGNIHTLNETLAELAEYIIENTQPYFLALHYYGEENYEKALQLVQLALMNKNKRDDSFAYDLWGSIFIRQKKYDAAIRKYIESIKINPKNDNPYIGLAYIAYKNKDYNQAINYYHKVLLRNPENYSAYNDLALVLTDKGDIAAAQDNYQKALALNPQYAIAYYNLGSILLAEGHYSQAILQFKKIIELPYHPENYFNAYNGLCYLLALENKFEEAISNCELAITIKPKDDNIYDTLGTVYFKQKNYAKALLNYQTAISYNADNFEAQQHLAETFAIKGDCQKANSHLAIALKLNDAVTKINVQQYCK